jgi:hypothetical protein
VLKDGKVIKPYEKTFMHCIFPITDPNDESRLADISKYTSKIKNLGLDANHNPDSQKINYCHHYMYECTCMEKYGGRAKFFFSSHSVYYLEGRDWEQIKRHSHDGSLYVMYHQPDLEQPFIPEKEPEFRWKREYSFASLVNWVLRGEWLVNMEPTKNGGSVYRHSEMKEMKMGGKHISTTSKIVDRIMSRVMNPPTFSNWRASLPLALFGWITYPFVKKIVPFTAPKPARMFCFNSMPMAPIVTTTACLLWFLYEYYKKTTLSVLYHPLNQVAVHGQIPNSIIMRVMLKKGYVPLQANVIAPMPIPTQVKQMAMSLVLNQTAKSDPTTEGLCRATATLTRTGTDPKVAKRAVVESLAESTAMKNDFGLAVALGSGHVAATRNKILNVLAAKKGQILAASLLLTGLLMLRPYLTGTLLWNTLTPLQSVLAKVKTETLTRSIILNIKMSYAIAKQILNSGARSLAGQLARVSLWPNVSQTCTTHSQCGTLNTNPTTEIPSDHPSWMSWLEGLLASMF